MKKNPLQMLEFILPLRTSMICLAGLAFLMMPCLVRAQPIIKLEPSAERKAVYNNHFTSYALGKMDKSQVATLLQSRDHFDTLTVMANDMTYVFELAARDVRSDQYVLRTWNGSSADVMPRSPNKTYSGKTIAEGLPVCITADETFFTAMITTPEGALFIESARLTDASAGEDQFVIYYEKNVIRPAENSLCGVTEIPSQDKPKQETSGSRSQMTCKEVEIAIANDKQMFLKYGSVGSVEVQNLAVINQVNTLFDNEFNHEILHKVTEIFVVTGTDPWYTGTNSGELLTSFGNWAIGGFMIPHDAASLWTNRVLDNGVLGLAWVDHLCMQNPYNILRDYTSSLALLRVLQTHELGHNYGYSHDADPDYIMSPAISETTTWSSASLTTLNTNFEENGFCLAACQTTLAGGRVGIGTTSPHNTAALEISSTNKGLLIPRLTPVQRNAIPDPADGLTIYDTHTKSFWFYNGSQWVELIDGTDLQKQATHVSFGQTGNVGIGLPLAPANKLDIATAPRTNVEAGAHPTNLPVYITGSSPQFKGLEVRNLNAQTGVGLAANYSIGGEVYADGFVNDAPLTLTSKGNGSLIFKTNGVQRIWINSGGNMGIGTAFANAPLQFSNDIANRKMVLYEASNNNHQYFGFGINPSTLRYQVNTASSHHVFYAGVNASESIELMRIQGDGRIAMGTSAPDPSAILDVSSTTKGMLIPRMTTAERNAITSPATGLLLFDTSTQSFWYRSSTSWMELSDHLDTELYRNGPDKIYMGLTDSVGIGTNDPVYKLDVRTSVNQYGFAHKAGDVELASWIGDGGEIGTISNHALRLFAGDGVNHFAIQPSGNIAIGFQNPSNRLDIAHGGTRTGGHAAGRPLYVTGNLGDASNGPEFRHLDGTQGIGIGRNTLYAAGSWADQNIGLQAKGQGNVLLYTNGAERFRFSPAGYLGIGVIPNAPLHFSNATVNRKIVLYEAANNDHQFFGFGVNIDGTFRYQVPVTVNDHVFYAGTSTTTSSELMRIRGNGNVTVSGNIEVETFTTPSLLNGFTPLGGEFANAAYYKDKMGRVFLRGTVNLNSDPDGVIIFTLPAGYRPSTSGRLIFSARNNPNNPPCRVDILANGNVTVIEGSAGWISLDGISFRAD